MEFHRLKTEKKGNSTRIIDPHQLKPIVREMGLEGKPTEEKVLALAEFAAMPKKFDSPRKKTDEDEYSSTYSSLALHYDEGNCRHRAAMFSALLAAAGIRHEIQEDYSGKHPYIHLELPNEHVRMDFNGDELGNYIDITVENGDTLHRWELHKDGVVHDIMGIVHGELSEEDIHDIEQLPEFEAGMNRLLLEKAKQAHTY